MKKFCFIKEKNVIEIIKLHNKKNSKVNKINGVRKKYSANSKRLKR